VILLFTALNVFCYNWFFKLTYAIRESNKLVSVFTLVALSLDRYLASYYNTTRLRTISVGKVRDPVLVKYLVGRLRNEILNETKCVCWRIT